MCRAEEQSASVFGHDGKLAALRLAANVEAVNDKQKVPDTPNERLVDVLREAPQLQVRKRRRRSALLPCEACRIQGE